MTLNSPELLWPDTLSVQQFVVVINLALVGILMYWASSLVVIEF